MREGGGGGVGGMPAGGGEGPGQLRAAGELQSVFQGERGGGGVEVRGEEKGGGWR